MTKSIGGSNRGISSSGSVSGGADASAEGKKRKSRGKSKPPGDGSSNSPTSLKKVAKSSRRIKFLSVLLLASGAAVGGLAYVRQSLLAELPDPNGALTFARRGTLTIKSADGQILQKLGPSTRDNIPFEDMPELVVQAFVASEDRRFYDHSGVDYQSIARAVVANVTAKDVVEGGSTITQQLARIAFLDQDRTLKRKAREALMAQRLEDELGKDKILERYLNLVYLGSGAYGVADAAWIYFGKTPDDLTLGEVATIAGVPPAPSNYSPLENPDIARERRNIVLQRMAHEGFITDAEASQASAEELTTNPKTPKYFNSQAPYFTTYVQKELSKFLTQEQIEAGGLTIQTSLNLEWQKHASEMVVDFVENEGYYQGFGQGSMAVIDPRNGQIKVMVGGASFGDSQFNRVTQAQRQPGSTFKTFVYTAAVASGLSPYKAYNDVPFEVDGYKPKNYGGRHSGKVDMLKGLTSSINIVALRTLIDVGYKPTISMAKGMGIRSKIEPTYSLSLGAWEVNLLELTSAYGTLANRGKYVAPHSLVRVIDRNGEVLVDESQEYKAKRVVDDGSSSIMTWMLQKVVDEGTGGPAYLDDRAVAGKTGTSEKARDLWFVGYIPQLVAGVWLGNDDNTDTAGTSGTAASLWREVMKELTADLEVEDFPKLPNLDRRKGSIKPDPIKPGSIVEGSIKPPEPVYYDEPEPYYEEPVYYDEPEPYYEEPVYYDEPEPYYEEPVYYDEPEPYYEEPVYYDEPEPYYEEPVYYDEPEPVYEEPVYEEPVYEEPVYEELPPPPPPPLPEGGF